MDDKSTSEVKFVNKSTHKLGFPLLLNIYRNFLRW